MVALLVLGSTEIEQVISYLDVKEVLSNQAHVFSSIRRSAGFHETTSKASVGEPLAIQNPHRTTIETKHHNVLFMPARLNHSTTVKIVSVPKPNDQLAPPGIRGTTLVIEEEGGRMKAVVNAESLTGLRTAAGSVLATSLIHDPSQSKPEKVSIFGGGQQGLYHSLLLSQLYPSITTITFVLTRGDRPSQTTLETIVSLKSKLAGKNVQVDFSADVEASVKGADIICCCTPSTDPLFKDEWVKDGTHLNLVGSYKPNMQEVPETLIRLCHSQGTLIVDSSAACSTEAGDLIKASIPSEDCIELGDLISDDPDATEVEVKGSLKVIRERFRSTKDDKARNTSLRAISIFKSVGVGVQDVAITALVVEKAIQLGLGQNVNF
ncbi:NAD(P)-binding protein [Violaceomyces palustris]|uniref:NAD(P)-binding protein n=1 Tax=Violaceomyces palustris TaxID=1673888 RepID=A0ACD0P6U8_9BASI|nr:NAD(P)-binding protein [Violaceomyces palustris]